MTEEPCGHSSILSRTWDGRAVDHSTRPEALYQHHWRVGDLLMWDNWLVQHRAIRNYEWPQRRLMHRTTVAGVLKQ